MSKLRNVVIAFILATSGAAVQAQSPIADARAQLIEDVAQAVAGTNVCTRYKPNPAALTIQAIRLGLRFNDPAVEAKLEERGKFHAERIKGRTPEDICAALKRLYGPEGSNVRNLVREG